VLCGAAPVAAQPPDEPTTPSESPNGDSEADEVVPPVPDPTAPVAEDPPEVGAEDPPRAPTVALEWGQGLTVRSDDGNFTLQIRSRVQAQVAFESARPGDMEP